MCVVGFFFFAVVYFPRDLVLSLSLSLSLSDRILSRCNIAANDATRRRLGCGTLYVDVYWLKPDSVEILRCEWYARGRIHCI